ncbi:uncharacterized protein [Blastocystis hominis]|uniref:phosphatidylserine decarboxylase n=1 Tax=Blastocystis hominis TaxID=12968 RepID=D8M3U5_BLAHO|nr:uncharacterized protein [Blastocystis hominis]CBK22568.2 unnamed protein product [Blastocystis hominis]|eukprot:XP_012896616.1 uncharacterized protein [Blastocystis hominis]
MDDPTIPELETLSPLQVAAYCCFMTRRTSRYLGYLMNIKIPRYFRRPLYSCRPLRGLHQSKLLFHAHLKRECISLSFIHTITPRLVTSSVILSFSFLPATARFLTWIPFLILESFSHFQNPITTPHLEVHQVKGIRYSMSTFLGSSIPYKNERSRLFTVTLYLSPSDYHRVHSPAFFAIRSRAHFPGKLLPVKNFFAQNVKGLFTLNERVVLTGSWPQGFFSLGLVGAYNVGSISLSNRYDRDLRTNCAHHTAPRRGSVCYRKHYPAAVASEPGDPVGMFHLGSTVVLAFEAGEFEWLVKPGEKVKMGQPLGYVRWTKEVEELIGDYENGC